MTDEERAKQEWYRDARVKGYYGDIWTTVGKCVFCDLRDKYVFYEIEGMVLTVPLYAYTDGQMMIVPRRHVTSIKELTEEEWRTVRLLSYVAKKLMREVHDIKGMQMIIREGGPVAQSTVGHLHIHCIPFDSSDLCTWNYRQLKYTPMENAELYRQRSDRIEKLTKRFKQKYQDD